VAERNAIGFVDGIGRESLQKLFKGRQTHEMKSIGADRVAH
jgi:hypothetical protein